MSSTNRIFSTLTLALQFRLTKPANNWRVSYWIRAKEYPLPTCALVTVCLLYVVQPAQAN